MWRYNFVFRCSIRFPSTSIRLFFQSLIEDHELLDRVDLPSPSSLGFGTGQGAGGSDDSMDIDRLWDILHRSLSNLPRPSPSMA